MVVLYGRLGPLEKKALTMSSASMRLCTWIGSWIYDAQGHEARRKTTSIKVNPSCQDSVGHAKQRMQLEWMRPYWRQWLRFWRKIGTTSQRRTSLQEAVLCPSLLIKLTLYKTVTGNRYLILVGSFVALHMLCSSFLCFFDRTLQRFSSWEVAQADMNLLGKVSMLARTSKYESLEFAVIDNTYMSQWAKSKGCDCKWTVRFRLTDPLIDHESADTARVP